MINFSLLDEAFPNEDKTSIKKKSKKDIKEIDKNTKEGRDCSPIQAPIYEIPNTCDNKQVFTNVINDSMKSDYNNYKKDGIKSFDFDEMDAYLNVTDITTNNLDRSPEYRTTPFLIEYLKSLRDNINNNNKTLNIEQFSNYNNSLKFDNNLILFMFLGIIIILLIDQITKLAIAIKS